MFIPLPPPPPTPAAQIMTLAQAQRLAESAPTSGNATPAESAATSQIDNHPRTYRRYRVASSGFEISKTKGRRDRSLKSRANRRKR